MPGCSANCASAPASSRNRSNTRPRRATCSRSSAARPSICSRCSTLSATRPRGLARLTPRRSPPETAMFTGPSLPSRTRPSGSYTPGRGTVIGRTLLECAPVQIADVTVDPDYALSVAAATHRTLLGVPLMREAEPIGVILLARGRVAPFTERQIELVRTFADQAVIVIENTRLLSELRESLEQQTATTEVLQVINSSPGELQPVFDAILEEARTRCGATRGGLHLFDGETFRPVAMQGHPQDWAEQLRRGISVCQTSIFAPLLAGAPFSHIADLRLIDDQDARAAAERGGVRTNLLLWHYAKTARCLATYPAIEARCGRSAPRKSRPGKLRGPSDHCDGQCPAAGRNPPAPSRAAGDLRQYGRRCGNVRRRTAARGVEPQFPADSRFAGNFPGRAAELGPIPSPPRNPWRVR
jgi:hypothetical protein